MNWIDYAITLVPLGVVLLVAWRTRRHVKTVADFMAASRCGGRYVICAASGEAGFGVVTAVATFEYIDKAGFALTWWQQLSVPVALMVTLTGFIVYRYRETRVMTLAQFFEIRYSKSFRIFAGVLAFLSGIVNYGIFPAVGARFFANYCGLPQTLSLIGASIPTFIVLMAVFISIALFLTLAGGQLTIMVTDCLQGLFSGFLYLVILGALLWLFRWNDIITALQTAPPGKSMINPFDTGGAKDFNVWYVLISVIGFVYTYMSWQGGHAFRASAANPHEAKMGNILSYWRGAASSVVITFLGICAFTYLKNPLYASGAAHVEASLRQILDPQIQEQMRVPVALSYLLPIGIKGAFGCVMLFAMLSCDSSYMHSWGSIFVQDVILPFRRKPFTTAQHLFLLRCAIASVGIFAFLFGILFRQTQYILMFFAITGAIFLGGSGSALIGGLYWKKGTATGAWCSMLTGSILATGGIVFQECWGTIQPGLLHLFPTGERHDYLQANASTFPLNGQLVYFISICLAVIVYIVVSLLTYREDFNLERMLHRGRYALDSSKGKTLSTVPPRWSFGTLLGFDQNFTLGDKFISGSVFAWSLLGFLVFVVGSLWYLCRPFSLEVWSTYWQVYALIVPSFIALVTTVWFTWGGVRDLRRLFRDLRYVKRSSLDDGIVVNHHNLDESASVEPAATLAALPD